MRVLIVMAVVALVAGATALLTTSRRGPSSVAAAEMVGEPEGLMAMRAASIAQTCAACHGTGGGLETSIPSLAGKPEAVLRVQLLAFKQDAMVGATVMPRLTKGYTDEELEAVARYFANLEPESD